MIYQIQTNFVIREARSGPGYNGLQAGGFEAYYEEVL